MTAVFPNFSSLPPELRNAIWKMALRQDNTGVHFFTVGNGPREVQLETGTSYRVHNPILFGAPIFDPNSDKSWAKNNRSTYLIDAGLWTACRESRTIIERKYETVQWKKINKDFQRKRRRLGYRRKFEGVAFRSSPCLGHSWRGAEDRTFVVFPSKDLFCLQQLNDRSLDRQTDCWNKFSQLSLSHLTYDNLQHLGFEFDETWNFDIQKHDPWDLAREDNARGFFFRILSAQWRVTRSWGLYLIDHGIRLKPNAYLEPMFHGNNCIYVHAIDFNGGSSADKFLRRMDNWAENHLDEAMTSNVQVLACVKE